MSVTSVVKIPLLNATKLCQQLSYVQWQSDHEHGSKGIFQAIHIISAAGNFIGV
jgi:hypothetical protein